MNEILGKKATCKITGFKGTITAHSVHLSGCDRVWLEPAVDKDGKRMEGSWFDKDMLELELEAPIRVVMSKPGGPPSKIK